LTFFNLWFINLIHLEQEKNMERIVIGKTGLEVYRLGFGGIPIQTVDEDQAVETVAHAVRRGVDFIETSRLYTTSERRIGLALQQTDKRVVVASKSQNKTSDGIQADLETSLKELQVGSIDLYQCHFVKDEEEYNRVISPGGALEGLVKAKEEGLIGHIGITSHSLDLLDRVLEDGLFETIMLCFSFLEPAAQEKIIPKAMEKNVGVITMKPFSGGFIENARLALKFVLSQPGTVVIPGVEHKDLFDENWEVFQGSRELHEAECKEIEEIRKRHDKVFCRRCDYCQPCSEEIPIQIILGLRSIARRMGKSSLLKGGPREAIEKARHCTECGECMTRCPYELPIPDLIKENLRWWDEQLKSSL
jgi:predicted aldo/keto reductase-like oxidoreductase